MFATESARKQGSAQRAAERQKQRPCAHVYLEKVSTRLQPFHIVLILRVPADKIALLLN